MKTALRNLAHKIVTPYPPADVPAGVFMAPSDVEIFESGFEQNEALFAANPRLLKQCSALSAFFNDSRGGFALKKAIHAVTEQRRRIIAYRRSPPSEHGYSDGFAVPKGVHPLDAALSGAPRTSAAGRLRLYLAVLVRAAFLIGETALIERRYGRADLAPERIAVGAPWAVFTYNWDAFRQAATDAGVWRDGGMAMIFDSPAAAASVKTHSWMRRLDAWRLPVDAKTWRAEVSRPARRLAWASVKLAAAEFKDVWALQAAAESLYIARESLLWRRVAANVRFDWVLDVEEYSPRHILKTAVFNAVGTRTVRWPHAIVDAPGAAFSYLCYNLFLSSGPDAADSYSYAWSDVNEAASTGLFCHDKHINRLQTPAAAYSAQITEKLTAGKKMLVYFLPSSISGFDRVVEDALRAILESISSQPKWFLVVKPKGLSSSRMLDKILKKHTDIRNGLSRADTVIVCAEGKGESSCSSSWLLKRAHAGVGVTSVLAEGLICKLPMVSYWPVRQTSRFQRKLSEEGLVFHEPDAFVSGLSRVLDGAVNISYGWFQDAFDPFADSGVLDRIARRLLGGDLTAFKIPETFRISGTSET